MNNNHKDEHLDFLKKKIKEIKIGLFKSEMNSELQLPNNIIEVLRLENDGNLWFFTSCSNMQAENIDKSFYGSVEFHKKGTDFRLQVSGKAVIDEKANEAFFNLGNYSAGTSERLVLVKMKIMQAEYFESTQPANVSLSEKIKSILQHIFLPPEPRTYTFS